MLGLKFDIMPADIDESYRIGELPGAHAERLAREKVETIAARTSGSLIVGSDTVVVAGGEVLSKPRDDEDAVSMLMRLQGRRHRVETGIAVSGVDGRIEGAVESVNVAFRPFDERAARLYVATGEPLDKAGAYGIQGYGATLVERIEGDFFAVMGLPITRMLTLFRLLGWTYNFSGFEKIS
jgi:septum formation protein